MKKSKSDEDLPDLKDPEVAKSAVKIQSVFRGFQTRKKMEEEMPDLKCAKVARAAIRIQKVYRGFQVCTNIKGDLISILPVVRYSVRHAREKERGSFFESKVYNFEKAGTC